MYFYSTFNVVLLLSLYVHWCFTCSFALRVVLSYLLSHFTWMLFYLHFQFSCSVILLVFFSLLLVLFNLYFHVTCNATSTFTWRVALFYLCIHFTCSVILHVFSLYVQCHFPFNLTLLVVLVQLYISFTCTCLLTLICFIFNLNLREWYFTSISTFCLVLFYLHF